jgi:hypothetical protein
MIAMSSNATSSTTSTTSTKAKKTPSKQRVTLFLKPSILKQAKAEAIIKEITLTQLVEKALIAYLPAETIIRKPNL